MSRRARRRADAPTAAGHNAGVASEAADHVTEATGADPADPAESPPPPPLGLPSTPLIHPVLGFSLRPWGGTDHDGAALVAAWADPEVARFTEVPKDQSLDAAERWIAKEQRRRASGAAIDLVISELGRPERIWGEVGLVIVEPNRRWAEIGYWVAPGARGRGVATGAVTLVAGWVQQSLPVARVIARTHPDNPASAVVAQRAGFVAAGSLPDGTDVWTLDGQDPSGPTGSAGTVPS